MLNYKKSGVDYSAIDPIKKLAQTAAKATAKHLELAGFSEIADTRGESAYVWKQGNVLMASVIEGLGTKNLVADAMQKITKKTYYDVVGHDTVASIINDLISVGARPLVLHAYWAVGNSAWLSNKKRMTDLITDTKLKPGDRIILLKSNGINMNGLSLARAIASRLPKGYGTKLSNGQMYGEAVLAKTNIYAKLIQDLFKGGIDIHYISNITGHGLRKVMRARQKYTYVLEHIFDSSPLFNFMQKKAGLSDYEMYQTFNMGQDYAIFVPARHIAKALKIIKQNKFTGLDAGYVEKGEKQVIIEPKNLIYKGDTLDLR